MKTLLLLFALFGIAFAIDNLDECKCGNNADCFPIGGGWLACFCRVGYSGDPYTGCTKAAIDNLDECKCGNNADCFRVNGKLTCFCRGGFGGDPYKGCTTVDNH